MNKQNKVEKIHSLSPMQEGMLFHTLKDPQSSQYLEQAIISLEGNIDILFLEKAFNSLVERHEMLRSTFVFEEVSKPKQVVLKERKLKINFLDFIAVSEKKDQVIQEFLDSDSKKSFDLSKDILQRISLVRTENDFFLLVWTFHHILLDGWSIGLLLKEFLIIYKSLVNNQSPELPIVKGFSHFIKWQEQQDKHAADKFWKNFLSGYDNQVVIPSKIFVGSAEQKEYEIILQENLIRELHELARSKAVTVNNIFQAAWGILLQKYSNVNDVVFGNVVSGRKPEVEGIENIVGLMINTVPLRVTTLAEDSFTSLALKMLKQSSETNRYDHYSLSEIFSNTDLRNDLLNHIIVFENYPLEENLQDFSETDFKLVAAKISEHTNYDLTVVVIPANTWKISFRYNSNVYADATIELLAKHLNTIIAQVLDNPDIKISSISLLSQTEKKTLLNSFDNLEVGYPSGKTIVDLFEDQVKKTPENIALVYKNELLSYSQLNEKANLLASILQEKGVGADCIVALLLDRSFEMIIGILAVLKAGGAYLPVDPEYPAERISFMLKDSGTKYLITNSSLKPNIVLDDINCIDINETISNTQVLVKKNIKPRDLAYIIYTSGSTGTPKGVMIEHRNVVRLLFNEKNLFDFNNKDVWTMFHSYCFDFSVWEMYGALLFGGKLVLVDKDATKDPDLFLNLVASEKVTVLNQTPGAFYNFIKAEEEKNLTKLCLRYVIFGGEMLNPALLASWKERHPSVKLINMYGITETTVHVTYKEIGTEEIENNISNIGQPIPTLSVYILDKDMNIQPVGLPGEICVGGVGLARGYLNRPEITLERFINHPFIEGEKLYRSGDLARYLPSSEIEYLGRIDNQVKIRGFRIELAEIESTLLKYPEVEKAVVLARKEEGVSNLCAYVVAKKELDLAGIRNFLSEYLPFYMVPAYIIILDKIPLTSNGKVDRKALPETGFSGSSDKTYQPARNLLEEKIAEAWKEVLKLSQIGVFDNYFSVGGDSIKAIRLVVKINEKTQAGIRIADVFNHQTISELASYIGLNSDSISIQDELKLGLAGFEKTKLDLLNNSSEALKLPEDFEDIYPLSSVEKGMIYSSLLRPDEPLYYDQFVFKLNIEKPDLLIRGISLLVEKHAILRTKYYTQSFTEQLKVVFKALDVPLELNDLSDFSLEKQRELIKDYRQKDIQKRFAFDNEVLWRMQLFRTSPTEHFLIWTFHHAMLDGWSVSVFNNELVQVCESLEKAGEVSIIPLKNSYKEYAAIMKGRQASPSTTDFWKTSLAGYTRNKLPFNITGKKRAKASGMKSAYKNLDDDLLKKLEYSANKNSASLKSLCLSAYLYLLKVTASENDIVAGVVTHERPEIEDGENILGCFLNTVPLRLNIASIKSRKSLIKQVSDYLNAMKQHELSLADIAHIIGEKTTQGNPIFDCLFNYLDFHVLDGIFNKHTLSFHSDSLLSQDELLRPGEMTNTLFDLEVSKTLGQFFVKIKYSPAYFDEADIEYALELYSRILGLLSEDGRDDLSTNLLLNNNERNFLLYEFNDTNIEYPRNKALHQLFEEQVIRNPESTSLIQNGKSISYHELNSLANTISHCLVENGIKSGQNIGLVVERSFNMIAGMLGILKSGGAYVPIDPEYPLERQKYILENSGVTCVLADDDYSVMNSLSPGIFFINLNKISLKNYPATNLNLNKNTSDLAYTIYTSGSTGHPKGVMIEHHSAVNLVNWVNKKYNVNKDDKLLFITSMCFDLSVYDIFGMLAAGGQIVIAAKDQVKDVLQLTEILKKEEITFWDSVPTTLNYLLNIIEEEKPDFIQNKLRLAFLSGDWIPVKLKDRALKHFPNTKFISLGGATEGTVWSNYYPIEQVEDDQVSIPYGKPIDNNYFYILDDNGEVVPKGVAGELYIGGVGVARGYANDDTKTNYSFVSDPFVKNQDWKMYRTGDLGRLMKDGNMEFLGRKDYQVKIRGFRVELGEIENRLVQHNLVKEAVVVDKADSSQNKYLCAYIVAHEIIAIEELKSFLAVDLPEYMIPSYFLKLEKLPLNQNGKVDRKMLPEPGRNSSILNTNYLPENPLQEKLLELWKDILGVENAGIKDNFFDLGGHSLNATVLISRIHKYFNVEIPLKELFSYPTVEDISKLVSTSSEKIFLSIPVCPHKEFYNVSSSQKRLFILHQLSGLSTAYNTPAVLKIEGSLDMHRFESCIKILIQRHENLRTTFLMSNGNVVQKVHADIDFSVQSIRENEILEDAVTKFIRPFDLEKGPLLRAAFLRTGNGNFLLFDMHHIISDGVSMEIFIKEFIHLYSDKTLQPLNVQYKDYSEWQQQLFDSHNFDAHERYWLETFASEIPVLDLPLDFSRPKEQSYEGNHVHFSLDKILKAGIDSLAHEHGTTTYVILLSAFNALLHRYSSQEDIIVGTAVSGRQHSDLESIIGMFVNTLPLRNQPSGQKTFSAFIEEVKDNSIKALQYQDYPFEVLLDKLNVERDMSRNPLFDVMFVYQNTNTAEIKIHDLNLVAQKFNNPTSKFDVSLEAYEENEEIKLSFEYCTSLFKPETIERFAGHFTNLVSHVVKDPKVLISEIEIISDQEKNKLLFDFNNNQTDYPRNKTIIQLFEEQVELLPERIAIVLDGNSLTYKELNERSNQLARLLIQKGVTKQELVPVIAIPSLEVIIGILAILKAGAAYLPVDPGQPAERIRYILADSNANIILNTGSSLSLDFSSEVINLLDREIFVGNALNTGQINKPEDLAYCIYTSGTTGKPKGTLIEQRSVIRLVRNTNYYDFTVPPHILQTGSLAFDVSTFEIWGSLLNGGTLYFVKSENLSNAKYLSQLFNEYPITTAWFTTNFFNSLVESEIGIFKKLSYLLIGGDRLSAYHVNKVKKAYPELNIINGYGPTENTVFTSCHLIEQEYQSDIPIGKPIANTSAYILDKNRKLVPIGVYGELCTGGDGVTRNYINSPGLNAEKFISNPYNKKERIYKTGDLARWRPDGVLEFKGRIDQQVKIRGFRVEMKEIEVVLLNHPDIIDAAVIDKADVFGNRDLHCYLVAESSINIRNIKDYLNQHLPSYMVPAFIYQLDKLPLNINGKLDKKALPTELNLTPLLNYEAPSNSLEEGLLLIWKELLNTTNIGVTDNFFELGGHSLKATQLASRVYTSFKSELSLKEIFMAPTIRALAALIAGKSSSTLIEIRNVPKNEHYDLSYAQRRLWFVYQLNKNNIAYNNTGSIFLNKKVSQSTFKKAFMALIERHESLRTTFKQVNAIPKQIINSESKFELTEIDLSNNNDKFRNAQELVKKESLSPFDLEKGPLLRALLVKMEEEKHLLIFSIHHIVSDGWSMNLIINELLTLYNTFENKESITLPSLQIQYKDYSAWQEVFLKTEAGLKQKSYWLKKLSGTLPEINVQHDFPRPLIKTYNGAMYRFELDDTIRLSLYELSSRNGSSIYMSLLSAVKILLYRYSGQSDIILGSPIAGRPHKELEGQIGFYVNNLVLRDQLNSYDSFKEVLLKVKQTALEAYDHQMYPYDRLIEELDVKHDRSRSPLFDIGFTWQNNSNVALNKFKERFNASIPDFDEVHCSSKYDLWFFGEETENGISFSIEYNTDLYKKETVAEISERLLNIIMQAIADENVKISSINFLESENPIVENNSSFEFSF